MRPKQGTRMLHVIKIPKTLTLIPQTGLGTKRRARRISMVSRSQQLQPPQVAKSSIIFRMRQRLPPIEQTVCPLWSDLFCICLSLWHRISQSVTQSIESNLSYARQVPCQTFVLTQPGWRFDSLLKLRMEAQGISKTRAEVSTILIETLDTGCF